MAGFGKNELAARRGYSYRLTRRQFLIASSAAALAACGPAAVAPTASGSPSASPGKTLKIGQLLPFTGVYAGLGNSMGPATEPYLKLNEKKLPNRPAQLFYEGTTHRTGPGSQKEPN